MTRETIAAIAIIALLAVIAGAALAQYRVAVVVNATTGLDMPIQGRSFQ